MFCFSFWATLDFYNGCHGLLEMHGVFLLIFFCKLWRILIDNFIKHKPLISEECNFCIFWVFCGDLFEILLLWFYIENNAWSTQLPRMLILTYKMNWPKGVLIWVFYLGNAYIGYITLSLDNSEKPTTFAYIFDLCHGEEWRLKFFYLRCIRIYRSLILRIPH